MRIILLAAACFVIGCAPCPERSTAPESVCHQTDAGALVANQPFTLVASGYNVGTQGISCDVSVDGGSLSLVLSTSACPAPGSANGKPAPARIDCHVPALPEGSYTLNDFDRTTFVTSDAGTALVQACP